MNRKLIFIILLLFFSLIGTATASTLEVGSGKTYTTITAAINAASSGDTIRIYNGTYNEQLYIYNIHDLTLQGVGNPVITATPTGSVSGTIMIGCTATFPPTLNEVTYNITIKDLTVYNNAASNGFTASGICTYYTKVNVIDIENCTINSFQGWCIWLVGTGSNFRTDSNCCNNTIIRNNTCLSRASGGIRYQAEGNNVLIEKNSVYAAYDTVFWAGDTNTNVTSNGWGINVAPSISSGLGAQNVTIQNNTVYCCLYSLIKCFAWNGTVQDNYCYGKARHNCYEYGFMNGGIFRNNTLKDPNWDWNKNNIYRYDALNNWWNPGVIPGSHMILENNPIVNETVNQKMLEIGGHNNFSLVRNQTYDCTNDAGQPITIFGYSGDSTLVFRSSDNLLFDNNTILNHSKSINGLWLVPSPNSRWTTLTVITNAVFFDGVGTHANPKSNPTSLSQVIRDNVTLLDCRDINDTAGVENIGIFNSGTFQNFSLVLANTNFTIARSHTAAGSLVYSYDRYYYTDIDVTEGGNPTSAKCRLYFQPNTSRPFYNEPLKAITANYRDYSQPNYTYQETATCRLNTPEYIETLSNGQTGTKDNPDNCVLLASTTGGDKRDLTVSPNIVSYPNDADVSYNITACGGAYNTTGFYEPPAGLKDSITVDANNNYSHTIGTKAGTVTNFHPTASQYKDNPYARGTVDLTIPITEYEKTIIPMGVRQ